MQKAMGRKCLHRHSSSTEETILHLVEHGDLRSKTSFQLVSRRWHIRAAAMAVKARKCSGLRS